MVGMEVKLYLKEEGFSSQWSKDWAGEESVDFQEFEVLQEEVGAVACSKMSVYQHHYLSRACGQVARVSVISLKLQKSRLSSIWSNWAGLQRIIEQGCICASAGMYMTSKELLQKFICMFTLAEAYCDVMARGLLLEVSFWSHS